MILGGMVGPRWGGGPIYIRKMFNESQKLTVLVYGISNMQAF